MSCLKLNSSMSTTLQTKTHLIACVLALLFLLLPTLNPMHFMVQGSQFSQLTHAAMRMRRMIGSKPPRCDGIRCKNCGHCEAVEVPIKKSFIGEAKHPLNIHAHSYSRGDDISNYKPMSWKCKCGDFFFNP